LPFAQAREKRPRHAGQQRQADAQGTLNWQPTDWLVPGNTWSHYGTWISALTDIAGSVGGYPFTALSCLRFSPRPVIARLTLM
jgi:hypothetical protein